MKQEDIEKLAAETGIFEPQLRELLGQHEDWQTHQGTQSLVTILQKRKKHYVDTLTAHILTKSDKELEDKMRSAISTCESILRIVSEPALFIKHLTKRD